MCGPLSLIEIYCRYLKQFASGLRNETALIQEFALNFGNRVSEIVCHGKKDSVLLAGDSEEFENLKNSRPYSRFDVQIRKIQCDLNTYCEEPENLEEYYRWDLGFNLDEKEWEIDDLIEENGMIEEIYNEIKKAEEARARLVNKRSISVEEEKEEEEDEFSSDVDDDDYEEIDGSKQVRNILQKRLLSRGLPLKVKKRVWEQEEDKGVVSESKSDNGVNERVHLVDGSESSGSMSEARSDELGSEGKTKNGGSCKDSYFSDVSSQPSLVEISILAISSSQQINKHMSCVYGVHPPSPPKSIRFRGTSPIFP
ncbi:hypothetical protein HYC85_020323 [Camellia sinensis]|uniref:Uncharacterized protein n=1 Tax=Camellia sinensis TaxID=4442 RepID=A0A7J7GRX2_CAMSI|nr:hypothetical protein HYC85_020323 [Camellia sinensis]